ncbi:MAG: hypothetical protein GC201_01415 [Alphaproteobacteria bacterium]|nr:hypothetical protein [Alphaproteobacteria bacterium]
MTVQMGRWLVVLSTLLLANCSALNDANWPNLANTPPELQKQAAAPAAPPAPPAPAIPAAQATATLDQASDTVASLASRLVQRRGRMDEIGASLQSEAASLQAAGAGGSLPADDWSRAEADLSRLGDDIGALEALRGEVGGDAAAAGGVVADLQPLEAATLDAQTADRLQKLKGSLDGLLAGQGTLDRDIGAALERWRAVSGQQAARLQGLAPAEASTEPPPQPSRPVIRKPATKPPSDTGPRESGDRFKGRQPLVTLNFADPTIEFENRLRALIDKVRAQYPDIAFDIESTDAPAAALTKVRSILKSMQVPSEVFTAPRPAGAPPAIKLFPR